MKVAMVMMPAWNIGAPPIATAYLSRFLQVKQHPVEVFDFNIELFKDTPADKRYLFDGNQFNSWLPERNFARFILNNLDLAGHIKKWARRIVDAQADIVGFSTYYSNYLSSMMLAEEIKMINRETIIIFGGPAASRHEQGYDFVKKDYIDIVVIGEGERILERIIHTLQQKEDIRKIPGTLCRENEKIYDNPPGEIEDINNIPFPTFDGFHLADYAEKMLPLLTSRGCINYCKFCAAKPLWQGYRYRKAESVLQEIEYLRNRYGINQFDFVDATVNGNIKELNKLCDLLIERKTGIYWGGKAVIRPEMDKEFLEKLYVSGCRWLSYGIESGSQKIVTLMGKRFNVAVAQKVLRNTRRAGIGISTFFIIGFPGETRWDFLMSLWFILKNRNYIGSISSGQKCGIPRNSLLYKNAAEYGITFKEDGWYSPGNTPQERELRQKIFKIATKITRLNVLHA